MKVHIKSCIPLVVVPLSSMDYLKSIKLALPLALLFPAGAESPMG